MTIMIWGLVPWSPLNEHGHDYTRAGGPVTPASCSISELEIHDLIRTRTQFRKSHDFCNADRIWGVLRRAGVFVDDATTQWRADVKKYVHIGGIAWRGLRETSERH